MILKKHVNYLGLSISFGLLVVLSLSCFKGFLFDSDAYSPPVSGEFTNVSLTQEIGSWDQVQLTFEGVENADTFLVRLYGPLSDDPVSDPPITIFKATESPIILYGLMEGSYEYTMVAQQNGVDQRTYEGSFTTLNCDVGTFNPMVDTDYGEWNEVQITWDGIEGADSINLILRTNDQTTYTDVESPFVLADLTGQIYTYILVAKKANCPDNYTTGTFWIPDCDLEAPPLIVDTDVGVWNEVAVNWDLQADVDLVEFAVTGNTEQVISPATSPLQLTGLNAGNHTLALTLYKAGCDPFISETIIDIDPCNIGTFSEVILDTNYGTYDEIELSWSGIHSAEQIDVTITDGVTPTTFNDITSPFSTSGLAENNYDYTISAIKAGCSDVVHTGSFEVSQCNMGTFEVVISPFGGWDTARFEWSGVTGQDQFDVVITDTSGTPTTYTDTTSPIDLTGLDGGTYTYEIRAIRAGCDDIVATGEYFVDECSLGTFVSSATPLFGGDRVEITWSGIIGEDQFDVYVVGPTNTAQFNVSSPLIFTGLAEGDYTYRIDAKKTGCPITSYEGSFSLDPCYIGTLSAAMDDGVGYWDQAELTWSGITNPDQYDLVITGDMDTTFADITSPYLLTLEEGTFDWALHTKKASCTDQIETGTLTLTDPGCPTGVVQNVTATDDWCSGIEVSWDTITGVTEYVVYRSTDSTGASPPYTEVSTQAAPPYLDNTMDDGIPYYYKVAASAPTCPPAGLSDYNEGFRYTPAFTVSFESGMPTEPLWECLGSACWYDIDTPELNPPGNTACSGCGNRCIRSGQIDINNYTKFRRTIYKISSANPSSVTYYVGASTSYTDWTNNAGFVLLLNRAEDLFPHPNANTYAYDGSHFRIGSYTYSNFNVNLQPYDSAITLDWTFYRGSTTHNGTIWVDKIIYTPPSDCN
jgi:hypothetical protein